MRKKSRGDRKKIKKLIIFSVVGIVCLFSAGYAAFSSNFLIGGKGIIVEKPISIDTLKDKKVDSGDGLYIDSTEENRYVYRGESPDNYISFNNELYRIVAIEADNSLKITKIQSLGNQKFDSQGNRDKSSDGAGGTYCTNGNFGCNAWSINNNFINDTFEGTVLKDSEANVYLNNEYYKNIDDASKNLIINYDFAVGPVKTNNTDLNEQINIEKSYLWNGQIGLMSVSDFIRANTNVEQCGTHALVRLNASICKTTNYLVPEDGLIWSLSPAMLDTDDVFYLSSSGGIGSNNANYDGAAFTPTFYLRSDINLSGSGTENKPYIIVD